MGFSSMTQSPIKMVLQKYLGKGEYPTFQTVPMFESNFFQVTKRGRHVFIHNHGNEAIIGIASTNAKLPLPNLMFIARPVASQFHSGPPTEEPVLTRLLPLKFVRISIHDPEKRLIKIKLINGRTYYLQFHATKEEEEAIFDHWLSLIYLLQHPPPCYLQPQPKSCTVLDNLSIQIIPSEEEAEDVKEGSPLPKELEKKKVEQYQEKGKPCGAAKTPQQSYYNFEEYSEDEKQILRAQRTVPFSLRDLFVRQDSFEAYKGSGVTTAKSSKKFSSETFLSGSVSATASSASSLPPPPPPVFPVPKKEGNSSSLNVVTVYSVFSKTFEPKKCGEGEN